jgi:dTDP-4-dehydrorhamnose reductase
MTIDHERVLLTGASGRLGTELQALLEGVLAPDLDELDLTRPETITACLDRGRPTLVVHAAAYTDVAGAETDRLACWRVNVEGTRHLAEALRERDLPVVHISTDYVFEGTRGGYREDDALGPVRNYYALTKLVAEAVVRIVPRHLVIRTSFRPREWTYPVAFDDLYTSQDYVDVIAPEIAAAVIHHDEIPHDTLHIATERKSVYELARRRCPEVERGSKKEAGVDLPDDVSLDTERWRAARQAWSR